MLWWCVQALPITWVLSGEDWGLTMGFAFLASANRDEYVANAPWGILASLGSTSGRPGPIS